MDPNHSITKGLPSVFVSDDPTFAPMTDIFSAKSNVHCFICPDLHEPLA